VADAYRGSREPIRFSLNRGQYVAPRCIVAVTDAEGNTVWENPVTTHRVLDSRVSYLMVSLLESVITTARERGKVPRLPAAGGGEDRHFP